MIFSFKKKKRLVWASLTNKNIWFWDGVVNDDVIGDVMVQRLTATHACTARRQPTTTCWRRLSSRSAAPSPTWPSSSGWLSTAASEWWEPRTFAKSTTPSSYQLPVQVRFNPLIGMGNLIIYTTSNNMKLVHCRWWVSCYIWYSEEGTGHGPTSLYQM